MALFDRLRFRATKILSIVKCRVRLTRLVWTKMYPIAGADDGGDGDAGKAAKEADGGGSTDTDENDGTDGAGDDAGKSTGDDPPAKKSDEPDWKAHARKHEREAKKARKERDEFATKLKEHEDASKSEQEKAIEKAREEARIEARSEGENERRHDRLDIAATKLAVRGVTMGKDDEDKPIVKKFADPDDALVYVERAIKAGDVDDDDVFDSEGKVKTDALERALIEILESKPHLAARTETKSEPEKPKGGSDAGKGSSGVKSLEDMSVEDHFKRVKKGD